MLQWLKSLMGVPTPAGPQQLLRAFTTGEPVITQAGIRVESGTWRVDAPPAQTVRLFEVVEPGVEQCLLAFRAELRTEGLQGRAYLEMWCRVRGMGEFFSKGLIQAARGTADWARFEVPFFLRKGQRPDLLKLNLVVEGQGTVWLRNLELHRTPLSS
jgi:hypothetical protein